MSNASNEKVSCYTSDSTADFPYKNQVNLIPKATFLKLYVTGKNKTFLMETYKLNSYTCFVICAKDKQFSPKHPASSSLFKCNNKPIFRNSSNL